MKANVPRILSRALLALLYIVLTVNVIFTVVGICCENFQLQGNNLNYMISRASISLGVFLLNIFVMIMTSQGPIELISVKYKRIVRSLVYLTTTLFMLSWGFYLGIDAIIFLEASVESSDFIRLITSIILTSLIASASVNLLQFSISIPLKRKRNEISSSNAEEVLQITERSFRE